MDLSFVVTFFDWILDTGMQKICVLFLLFSGGYYFDEKFKLIHFGLFL